MNAIVVIDKPEAMTSHDVVKQLRRLLREPSLGHLGTLDPMATGVLPLLVGRFTRLARFFDTANKRYVGTIRLGFSTDTYDAEGAPSSEAAACHCSAAEIHEAAQRLRGKILQTPPSYSAKKISGQPAYKLARKGEPVELKPVPVEVYEFTIGEREGDVVGFSSLVSSGTYIRSLAHELGRILGCGAHLASLRRTESGEFCIGQAVGLGQVCKELADGKEEDREVYRIRIIGHSIHPRTILPDMPCVTADPQAVQRIGHGQMVNLPQFSDAKLVKVFANRDDLICIAERLAGTLFHPQVVLI